MSNSQIMVDHSHRDPDSWHGFLRSAGSAARLYRVVRHSMPTILRRWIYNIIAFTIPKYHA